MPYIHENSNWPDFTWDSDTLSPLLASQHYREDHLVGQMQTLGFNLRQEANLKSLTEHVVKSFAIEGATLNPDGVPSSIARHLGMDIGGLVPASRDIDGVVGMMLDATQNFVEPLTAERLFGCLNRSFDRAETILRAVLYKATLWEYANRQPINERQRLIINSMLEEG